MTHRSVRSSSSSAEAITVTLTSSNSEVLAENPILGANSDTCLTARTVNDHESDKENTNVKKLRKTSSHQNVMLKKIPSSLMPGNKVDSKWAVNTPPQIVRSGFNLSASPPKPAAKDSSLSLSYNSSNFSLNSGASSSTSLNKKRLTVEDIKFNINDDQLTDLRHIVNDLFAKVSPSCPIATLIK